MKDLFATFQFLSFKKTQERRSTTKNKQPKMQNEKQTKDLSCLDCLHIFVRLRTSSKKLLVARCPTSNELLVVRHLATSSKKLLMVFTVFTLSKFWRHLKIGVIL